MGRGGDTPAGAGRTAVTRSATLRSGAENYLGASDLDFAAYSEERRDDLITAVTAVLEAGPSDPPADPPRISTGTRPLPESAPKLLGVTGKARSGKDVCTEYISDNFRGVERMAFSDAIVDEVNEFLAPLDRRIAEANKSEPHNRHILQAWALGRIQEDPMYWAKRVQAKVEDAWARGVETVLVAGVRRHDDVETLRALGGEVWRVERPGNPYVADHPIEQEIGDLDVDQELLNDIEGDLGPLHQRVEEELGAASKMQTPAGICRRGVIHSPVSDLALGNCKDPNCGCGNPRLSQAERDAAAMPDKHGWAGEVETENGPVSYHAHGERKPDTETVAVVERVVAAAAEQLAAPPSPAQSADCADCKGTGHEAEPAPSGEPISTGPCRSCAGAGVRSA